MLEQLVAARRVFEGHELVPAWRINTAEGTFLIFTRFDTDKDEQRERTPFLISRFMVWKMATSFVLTAQTWLGAEKTRSGDEALLAVGVRVTSAWRFCSALRSAARSISSRLASTNAPSSSACLFISST